MFSEATRTSGIHFDAQIDPVDGLLSKEAEINLYRVVQEAANNVIKHSHAASGKFVTRKTNQSLQVTIQDDGRGFDLAAAEVNRRGFGLVGMAERIRLSGGTFAVHSAPLQGTIIEIQLPVKADYANS